ncbi:MAG: hypothetical protein ACT4PX_02570 [Actinomycetota bacterium]
MTPPSPSDSEWFDDPRLEEIFASWAESNHPSARGTRAKAPDPAAEKAERPSGEAGPGDAGPGDAGPGDGSPGDAGPGDAGDDLYAWSDAGAGVDWDVPDLRQAWTGADPDPAPGPPESIWPEPEPEPPAGDRSIWPEPEPEPQPEPPAGDGPWARDRDDVIPAPRRRRWGRRKG